MDAAGGSISLVSHGVVPQDLPQSAFAEFWDTLVKTEVTEGLYLWSSDLKKMKGNMLTFKSPCFN